MNSILSVHILEKYTGPSSGPSEKSKEKHPEALSARLSELERELNNVTENGRKWEIRWQILGLRRELNRSKQFTSIANNKNIDGAWSLDDITASNLLKIDKESAARRWELLSKTFLYKRTTDANWTIFEEPSDGKNLKPGDTVYVDFGKNKSANRHLWAGHMLDVSIEYIKINGVVWVRSIIQNRVWYYTKNSASGYLAIYSWDQIEIPTASEVSKFEEGVKSEQIVKNTTQQDSDTANDIYAERLESMRSISTVEINYNTQESYDFWKSKGLTHEQAVGIVANEYRESSANPRAIGDNGKAFGIFQWHPDRRESIKKWTGIDITKATHREQLEAAWWEMNNTESRVLAPLKDAKTPEEAAWVFSTIYERPANTANEEAIRGDMAKAFALLLDPKWKGNSLGDYVAQIGPARLGENSCWAAVRELLKQYGITGLPESWADGKNWENILNAKSGQFVKMPLNHPDDAYPWAILVFDGSGSEWSAMNKKYWHVEIKWSDGKYYSYYESVNPGWSAAVNEKNPSKYQELTGFIWYAYYPRYS